MSRDKVFEAVIHRWKEYFSKNPQAANMRYDGGQDFNGESAFTPRYGFIGPSAGTGNKPMVKQPEPETNETYEELANYNPKKLYAMMDSNPERFNKIVAEYQERTKNKK